MFSRSALAASCALAVCVASPARSQSLELRGLVATERTPLLPDGSSILGVGWAGVAPDRQLELGLRLAYAQDLLRVVFPGEEASSTGSGQAWPWLERRGALSAAMSVSWPRLFSLGFSVPLLLQSFRDLPGLASARLGALGLGSPRLVSKLVVFDVARGPGLAFGASVELPARGRGFEGVVSASPFVLVSFRAGALRAATSISQAIAQGGPDDELGQNELRLGLGIEHQVLEELSVRLAATGAQDFRRAVGHLEVLGGAAFGLNRSTELEVSGGAGFLRGPGTPSFRVELTLRVAIPIPSAPSVAEAPPFPPIATATVTPTALETAPVATSTTDRPQAPIARDSDADGVLDELDNCLVVANRDQLDEDEDGRGDACDGEPFPTREGLGGILDVPDAKAAALGGGAILLGARASRVGVVPGPIALSLGLGRGLELGLSTREPVLPRDPERAPLLFGLALKLQLVEAEGWRPAFAAGVTLDRFNVQPSLGYRLAVSTARRSGLRFAGFVGGMSTRPGLQGIRPIGGVAGSWSVVGPLELVAQLVEGPGGALVSSAVRFETRTLLGLAAGVDFVPSAGEVAFTLAVSFHTFPAWDERSALSRAEALARARALVAPAPRAATPARKFRDPQPRLRFRISPSRVPGEDVPRHQQLGPSPKPSPLGHTDSSTVGEAR
ncbi:MAG: hypothetical protein HYV07_32775 [Deltaproteobacteria bacterium]|nr:hypothetical protein [Deltaproteobacteria bacterium]